MIDKRDYGLNPEDRRYVIERKFGSGKIDEIALMLNAVKNQSEKVLGAILFLACEQSVEDIESFVKLANENEMGLLTAATVKHERITGKLKN